MPSSGTNLTLQRRHSRPWSVGLLAIGLFVLFILFYSIRFCIFYFFETGSHIPQIGLEFSLSYCWLQIPYVGEASLGLDFPKCCNYSRASPGTTTPGSAASVFEPHTRESALGCGRS